MQEKRESTVANLVEALLKLPPNTVIKVGKEVDVMGGWATTLEHHPVDLDSLEYCVEHHKEGEEICLIAD